MTRVHVKLLGPCFKTGQEVCLLYHTEFWTWITETYYCHSEYHEISYEFPQQPRNCSRQYDPCYTKHSSRTVLYSVAITLARQATFHAMTDHVRTNRCVEIRAIDKLTWLAQSRPIKWPHSMQTKLTYQLPHTPPQHFLVFHWPVSRTIELSLQSSFQLSLMVLVRYRTRVIFSLRWSLPPD